VAKDNTVQYHGENPQIFRGTERRSYARTYVEVQERFRWSKIGLLPGKDITPTDAPALAASLRANGCAITDIFLFQEKLLIWLKIKVPEVEIGEPQWRKNWY